MAGEEPELSRASDGGTSAIYSEHFDILSQAFEIAPDAQLLVNSDGNIIRANRQCAELFGYAYEEFPGLCIESLIPERFVRRHATYRQGFITSPRLRPMGADADLFALRKDGSELPVGIMLSYMDTPQGRVALTVVRDVSERKKAEAKFRGLLESAPDAIVIVNDQGRIELVNSQTEKVFGYPRSELLNEAVEKLIPHRYHEQHPSHREKYFSKPRFREMGQGLELFGRRKSGEEFPIEISLSPLQTEEGMLVSSAIRDITDRKKVEEQLLNSLNEKETLLREIHHRVKNNLAVIASTFYLQSTYVADKEASIILENCQNRVRSMALVHEKLYHSGNFAAVDFGGYTKELCNELVSNYSYEENAVQLTMEIDRVKVGLNKAVPCALILNELVSNCLKHAFSPDFPAKLNIALTETDSGGLELIVSDNGVGIPQPEGFEEGGSFGMRLVRTLTRQLDGTLEFSAGDPGTIAKLSFEDHD